VKMNSLRARLETALPCVVLFLVVVCAGSVQAKPQVLKVLDQRSQEDFKNNVEPLFANELVGCKTCQWESLTKYDDKGQALTPYLKDPTSLGAPAEFSAATGILLINTNIHMRAELKAWTDWLTEVAKGGTVIVFAAGQPEAGTDSAPLTVTVAGKIPGALIIGELGERDRLWGASFYGPEMFTAVRPSKERIGLGLGPVQFAARMLKVWTKKPDWNAALAAKKATSHKIWLDLWDCFGL